MTARPHLADSDQVVLVDTQGNPTGVAPRSTVHGSNTPRHLAFSSYLSDGQGHVLMTRRSLSKQAWPSVWSHSACGHPLPGKSMEEAVSRRIREELGCVARGLQIVLPTFEYRATNPNGLVENELCPVVAGIIAPGEVDPDFERS